MNPADQRLRHSAADMIVDRCTPAETHAAESLRSGEHRVRFRSTSSIATARRILPLLLRRETFTSVPALLMIAAFTACSALFLTVAGGCWAFMSWPTEGAGEFAIYAILYKVLAGLAAALLIIPAVSLGQAAATLSARREDERLSTLSLLGASAPTVTLVSVAEPIVMSAIGTVFGVGGYLLLAYPLSRLNFQGHPLGYDAMMLPGWILVAACSGLVVISAVSALVGLRRIVVSPLGVRTKSLPAKFPLARIVTSVCLIAAVGVALFISKTATSMSSLTTVILVAGVATVVMVAIGLIVIDVLGVLFVRLIAWLRGRMAGSVPALVGARLVSANPKQYWRRVSGVAMTAFTATFAGTGAAFFARSNDQEMSGLGAYLGRDVLTGILLTLGIAFLFVTASAVLNQAGDIYDRADTYRELHAAGMSEATVRKINVAAVMMPVVWVSAFAGGLGLLLVAPLAGMTLALNPLTFLVLLGSVVIGVLIVRCGLLLTNPLIRSVTRAEG